jgi:hypothetical protein
VNEVSAVWNVYPEAGDAVITNVSGAAITQHWLAPQMRDVSSPCSSDLESWLWNDRGRLARSWASSQRFLPGGHAMTKRMGEKTGISLVDTYRFADEGLRPGF